MSSSPTPFGGRITAPPATGPSGASIALTGSPFQTASISKPSATTTTFSFGNGIDTGLSSSSSSQQPPVPNKASSRTASLFGGNATASSSSTPFGGRVAAPPAAGSSGASIALAGSPFQTTSISKPSAAVTTTYSFGNSAGGSVPSAPVFGTGIVAGTIPFSTSSSTFGGAKTGSPQSSFGTTSFGGTPLAGFGKSSFGVAPNLTSTSSTPSFGGFGVPSAPALATGKVIGTSPFATGSSTFGSTSFSTARSTAGVGLFGSVGEGSASTENVGNLSASDSGNSSGGASIVLPKQNSSFTKFRG